jgi:glutaredoxin 2
MLDYLAQVFFNYRNFGYQESPAHLAGYFSKLAHVFFTGIKLIEAKEREEMLKYFYEWRDVTPGNFEELLARTIELIYDHQDIYASMSLIEEFLKVVAALWKKLSTLEYIGQRKENIVVAEQQIVQQVQAKRTWTLLD